MYIFGYNTTLFIQNLNILVKLFGKNFIFRVKSTNFLVFRDQIYICGYKTTVFRVKSTNFLVFRDQMYIFGYKTTVFIQNLHILVKLFGKNFIFRVKGTNFFVFSGPNVHFWVQNYSVCPKFTHFSEIVWQKLHF